MSDIGAHALRFPHYPGRAFEKGDYKVADPGGAGRKWTLQRDPRTVEPPLSLLDWLLYAETSRVRLPKAIRAAARRSREYVQSAAWAFGDVAQG